MEPTNLAQLNSALTKTERPSAPQLSNSDSEELETLILQMADRYPSQDLSGALKGYLHDFGRLALRYGLPSVKAALSEMRIKPGQAFFPRPDEVAEEIVATRDKTNSDYQRDHPFNACGINGCVGGTRVVNKAGFPYDFRTDGHEKFVRTCQCKLDWIARKKESGA